MISIALIEDNRLVSDGISSLLNRQPDLRVVSNGGCDMSQLCDIEPHVVLAAFLPGVLLGARARGDWETFDELPIPGSRGKTLAVGSVASCVVVDSAAPRLVIKSWRYSLGCPVEQLVSLARELQHEYETVKRWYHDIPNLLPRTVHVVMKAPMHGLPAVAAIQELVVEPATDLLRDHSDEALVDLLRRHDALRSHVGAFAKGTRRAWDEEGRFLDMIGRDNVMLVETDSGPQLRIADFGIWDVERQRRDAPHRYSLAEQTLDRLERLADRVR
jgi:DNA-binding NarL/FixJ family response regulator